MTARPEYIMKFTFKLVYTNITHNLEISSNESMNELFEKASLLFAPFINYNKYYIDFVIAGQKKGEMARSVGCHNLDEILDNEYGNNHKQLVFYVRPMDRNSDTFVRMDQYNEEFPPPPGLIRRPYNNNTA